MRIWARLIKNNHIQKDMVIENYSEYINRTKKIFHALDEVCYAFDLGHPLWLDSNISEFQRHSRVRFMQDSFVEYIDFDYLDFQVIEED